MLWQLKKDLETWQILQETTAKLLGVSLLLIDSQGEPVTDITNACLFCEAVRSKEVCLHSDRRAATHCIQQKKSHLIYRCPYQFVNIVFPIYVDRRPFYRSIETAKSTKLHIDSVCCGHSEKRS